MSQETEICKNDQAFYPLTNYCNTNKDDVLCKDIKDAQQLYGNAKFYYLAGQFSGSLVSYSCAAVLLNSIIHHLQQKNSHQDLVNAASQILQCCLEAVNVLQPKVLSQKSDGKDDEEKRDWEKICTKIKPLVFSKGSVDCLFFSGVAGMNREKKLFKTSLVYPLIYPNLYPKASKGILLYGPPGTGKTYIAKAAVNELQKQDKSVGVLFFAPSPGELKGKYVGETEKRIEEIFNCASRAACESELGCHDKKKYQAIIFMDEFDAIAQDRSDDPTGLAANSVNTLLQMMDGINSKPNVAVIAATNFPWKLDGAVLRRFDTQILIGLPSASDIREVMNIEMKKVIKFKPEKLITWCEGQKQVKDKTEDTVLSCDFECVEEIPEDLSTQSPYNQVQIDYYNDKEYMSGLVQYMFEKNFSNSDVSRFMKTAQVNSGELSVKSNLFYKASMIGDFTQEIYISSLTKIKDEQKAIEESINLLKSFVEGSVDQNTQFYQVEPPDILRIEYNGYYYYNIKALLYKDNKILVDHPLIKDIYIKVHKKGQTNDGMGDLNVREYKKNVLGVELYEQEELVSPGDLSFIQKKETEKTETIPVDIIISFDFYIKQKSTDDSKKLLPYSTELINKIVIPMYNAGNTVFEKMNELNKQSGRLDTDDDELGDDDNKDAQEGPPLGDLWFNDSFRTEIIPDVKKFKDKESGKTKPILFDLPLEVAAESSIITEFLETIQKDYETNIVNKTSEDFYFKFCNFDFYNYLLLFYVINKQLELESATKIQKVFRGFVTRNKKQDGEEYQNGGALPPNIIDTKNKNNFVDFYVESLEVKNNISIIENLHKENNIFQELEPITIKKNVDGSELNIIYNKGIDTCYIKLTDFKNLIKSFKDYNDRLNLFGEFNEDNLKDFWIAINSNLFKIIFRNVLDNKNLTQLTQKQDYTFPEYIKVKDGGKTFTDVKQRIIQLLINDILKFKSLTEIVYKNDKAKTIGSNAYIGQFLKKIYHTYGIQDDTKKFYLNLLNLVVERVYNNVNFCETGGERFRFIGRGGDNITIDETILSDTPDENVVLHGGKKKFRLTSKKNAPKISKKISKKKGKPSRKQIKSQMNKTKRLNKNINNENNDKINIEQKGGAEETYIKFTKAIISLEPAVTKAIINKSIFIATQFDYSVISGKLLYNSALAGIFYSAKDLFSTTNKDIKSEQNILELQKKNQYLPLVFKKIESIGFLTDDTQKDKTLDDKNIKDINISWSQSESGVFSRAFWEGIVGSIASGMTTQSDTNKANIGVPILMGIITQMISEYTQNDINLAPVLLGILLASNIITTTKDIIGMDYSKEEILNSIELTTIFNLITEIGNIELDEDISNKSVHQVFNDAITKALKKITWWQSTVTSFFTEFKTKLHSSKSSPAEIKKYDKSKLNIDSEIKKKLTNLNIPIQSFSYAATIVKTTYDKETGRQLQLYDTDKEALLKELRTKK